MESRIPLPTDNIFKFYALFGLLLLVFSIGAVIYLSQTTNNLVFKIAVEYETLKADPMRSVPQETRLQVLEKKMEIAKQNKDVFLYSLGALVALGVFMMWYGFKKWHTEIQPIQDEIARLRLKQLKQDVGEDESA